MCSVIRLASVSVDPNDVEVLVCGECTVLLHRTRMLLELPLALSVCTAILRRPARLTLDVAVERVGVTWLLVTSVGACVPPVA